MTHVFLGESETDELLFSMTVYEWPVEIDEVSISNADEMETYLSNNYPKWQNHPIISYDPKSLQQSFRTEKS